MKGNIDVVYCEFKYSGVGSRLLAAAAIVTLALVVAMPFTAALRASLGLLVLALAGHANRKLRSVRAIRVDAERAIVVEGKGDDHRTGAVRGGCFVAPWLTIVRWRPQGAWFDRTVLILPGMVRADEFRALRVLLRWS